MFSLFLLALTLLVLATLSLSRLTHQKMEMQIASDTAAYSQAVATARAYNSVALLNRAQLATMVALTGVDSAVSFAGSYRAALNATWYGYVNEWDQEYCGGTNGSFSAPRKLCGGNVKTGTVRCSRARVTIDWKLIFSGKLPFTCAGPGGAINGGTCKVLFEIFGVLFFKRAVEDDGSTASMDAMNALLKSNDKARLVMIRKEINRVKGIWQQLDDLSGLQARRIQAEAATYGPLQAGAIGQARAALQPMAQASLAATGATLNPASTAIANREVGDGFGPGVTDNGIDAAMGSRAHTFITRREDGQRALQTQIRKVPRLRAGPPTR